MKVTDYDYETIRLMVYGPMMQIEHGPIRKTYDEAGHSAERRRWDAFWSGTAGRHETRNDLVQKYTDDHRDTALRKIQREAASNG